MMLSKLALKNVKTQFKNYFMYFASMAFSVMVYYSFVSMSYDQSLVNHTKNDLRIDSGLKAGSVMIILFIIVFMFSANSFFVKRRKREIGLYSLLGMRRSQIGRLFFVETMILGILALVTGIFFGVLFSKFFAMLLLKAIQLPITMNFIVSFAAMKDTVQIFLLILVLVSIRTASVVYRYKLITLFKAEEQGEGGYQVRWYNWVLGILGLGLLITGYTLASNFFDFMMWTETKYNIQGFSMLLCPLIILALCVIGTYLFFGHFIGILLKLIEYQKIYYYRDINMVSMGNLSFQLKKNGRVFATIAVLSGTALAAIGGAVSFQSYTLGIVDYTTPASYAVADDHYQDVLAFLRKEEAVVAEDELLTFKYVGGRFNYENSGESVDGKGMFDVVSLSNYQKIQQMLPNVPDIQLKGPRDVAWINDGNPAYIEQSLSFDGTGLLGDIGEVNLVGVYADYLGNTRDMRLGTSAVVVPDELFDKLSATHSYQYHLINVENADNNATLGRSSQEYFKELLEKKRGYVAFTEEKNHQMVDHFEKVEEPSSGDYPENYVSHHVVSLRYPNYSSLIKSSGLLIYVAVFLGIVFMIATGSIITLKQLSEAEDEKQRYEMLRKIGTPKEMIKRSLYKQNSVVFFVPLVISLLHAYFAIKVLLVLIVVPSLLLTYLAVVFLILIYLIFYFATSSAYNTKVNS